MKGILFYSYRCRNCINMWKILEKENFLQFFEKMNIDNLDIKYIQNLGISQVPSILIIYPNGKKLLKEARNAFIWIDELLKNRRENISKMVNLNRLELLKKNKELVNQGFLEYSNNEMGGKSDEYAYLVTDIALPKSYVNYGDERKDAIITYSEIDKLDNEKLNNELILKKDIRNNQDVVIKDEMKKGQIEAIYDNNMIN